MRGRNYHSGKSSETFQINNSEIKGLEKLIREGEGYKLEFKAKANHPDKIARSICAFANSGGGILLLGVLDQGIIKGVRYPDEDIHSIFKLLRTARPFLRCKPKIIPVSGNYSIVRFDVQENKRKPVVLKADKGLVYIRIADECLQAGPVTAAILRRKSLQSGNLINFGEAEKKIIGALSEGKSLRLAQIASLTGFGQKILIEKLVPMAIAGLISVLPKGSEEEFRFNN